MITISDRIKAAEIISRTPSENLPYVIQALGLDELEIERPVGRSSEEDIIRESLDFGLNQKYWSYMSASQIAEELFNDKELARTVGKMLIEVLGYKPKKS